VTVPGLSPLALGTAALAGLFGDVGDEEAVATIRAAVAAGVRYLDTSPWYGLGLAEARLGSALSDLDRATVTVSTKAGYVVGSGRDRAAGVQDFSPAATERSVELSLRRLGLDAVDIVYLHDPDTQERQALDGAYPVLHRLREEGVVKAIGVGMNSTATLTRFVRDCDLDVVLAAGRYTLLDRRAGEELLPLCLERGVGVVIGGVFNSGILADPRPGARFDYQPAPASTLERARSLQRICAYYQVPLAAAALQFPLRHPAVTSVLMGPRNRAELAHNLSSWTLDIPAPLWKELAEAG
jgi:D-threo-aldose 1-dehydrogenase